MKESLSLLRNYNKARYPLLSSGFSRSFAAEPDAAWMWTLAFWHP